MGIQSMCDQILDLLYKIMQIPSYSSEHNAEAYGEFNGNIVDYGHGQGRSSQPTRYTDPAIMDNGSYDSYRNGSSSSSLLFNGYENVDDRSGSLQDRRTYSQVDSHVYRPLSKERYVDRGSRSNHGDGYKQRS